MTKVVITQSNYIPWKGFFDSVAIADEFVLYDDVQYTRRDWRNRNRIKSQQGSRWLTIPVAVKGKYTQRINETVVSDEHWAEKHWRAIETSYRRAPCFHEVKDFIEHLYRECNSQNLSEINRWFMMEIARWMGLKARFSDSTNYHSAVGRTERLVSICQQLGCLDYYTGPAAKDYLDEEKFSKVGITVHYFDYSGYREYDQIYPPFDHAVSILDLLVHTGSSFRHYMKHV